MSAKQRLESLGLVLPKPPAPAGAYTRAVRAGNLLFLAGQLPVEGGKMIYEGKVGADLSLEEGYSAFRLCALNALSILEAEAGSLESIRLVRMTGFVCSADGFTDQPKAVNGASELMSAVLEERGTHARLAVGVAELPLGAAAELEVIAEISG